MERETNKLSKSIDPYTYAIKVKHQLLYTWLAVGHIIRENHATAICLWKKVTPYYWTFNVHNLQSISDSCWRLEVPLLLTFSLKSERIFKLMKSFVNDLYDYNYTGEQAQSNEEESYDDEEIDIKLTGQENSTNENNENVLK